MLLLYMSTGSLHPKVSTQKTMRTFVLNFAGFCFLKWQVIFTDLHTLRDCKKIFTLYLKNNSLILYNHTQFVKAAKDYFSIFRLANLVIVSSSNLEKNCVIIVFFWPWYKYKYLFTASFISASYAVRAYIRLEKNILGWPFKVPFVFFVLYSGCQTSVFVADWMKYHTCSQKRKT